MGYEDEYREYVRRMDSKSIGQPLVYPKQETDEQDKKIKSDGWATSYYDIPASVKDVDDLIMHFNLNWHMANIVKAAIRYGRKEGISKGYDLNKILFMAEREKEYIND